VGSSGEKRKGRRHLPKVGTAPEEAWVERERREEALHPFSTDLRRYRNGGAGVSASVVAALVALLVVVGVIALVLFT
jgi:hypothetical protein